MKSLPHSFALCRSPSAAEAASRPLPSAFDDDMFDDTPTVVHETLGSLIARPAVVVTTTTPLGEVRTLLIEHRVPAVAVVDANDQLRGVVTRTDVLRALGRDGRDATAADAMSTFVFALPARSSIEKAAALMAYEGVAQVVVTGPKNELVGMVSALDVTRYFAIEAGYLVE